MYIYIYMYSIHNVYIYICIRVHIISRPYLQAARGGAIGAEGPGSLLEIRNFAPAMYSK